MTGVAAGVTDGVKDKGIRAEVLYRDHRSCRLRAAPIQRNDDERGGGWSK